MNFFNSVKQKQKANQLIQVSNSTLLNLKSIVKLPIGEDLREWIALHVIDFLKQLEQLNFIECHCDVMNIGSKYEFLWKQGYSLKRLTAKEYIEEVLRTTRSTIENQQLFPTNDSPFPKNFIEIVKIIFKRFSRVYGHFYMSHFETYKKYQVDDVLNTSFKHFVYFVLEFDLISKKDLMPLDPLLKAIGVL